MNRKEKDLIKEVELAKAKLEKYRSKIRWKCPSCNTQTEIGKLTLQIQQEYDSNLGSPNGGYDYTPKEPTYYIECPKCQRKHTEKLFWGEQVEDNQRYEKVHTHVYNFKSRVKVYSNNY